MGVLRDYSAPFRDADGLLPVQRDFLQYLEGKGGSVQARLTDLSDSLGYERQQISRGTLALEEMGRIKITRYPHVWGPAGCNKYELIKPDQTEPRPELRQ